MEAKIILELEGRTYELKTADINIFIKENYVTVWTDDNNSFDISLAGKKG